MTFNGPFSDRYTVCTRILGYVALVFALMGLQSTSADVYKWTDEKGKIHFSDAPPAENTAEKLDEAELAKRISSYTNVSVSITPIDFGYNRQANSLIMYTTSRCGYCAKARKYFAKKRIPFEEKNIDISESAKAEFDDFGGKGVPVILIGRYSMTGFSESRFEEMYAKVR